MAWTAEHGRAATPWSGHGRRRRDLGGLQGRDLGPGGGAVMCAHVSAAGRGHSAPCRSKLGIISVFGWGHWSWISGFFRALFFARLFVEMGRMAPWFLKKHRKQRRAMACKKRTHTRRLCFFFLFFFFLYKVADKATRPSRTLPGRAWRRKLKMAFARFIHDSWLLMHKSRWRTRNISHLE